MKTLRSIFLLCTAILISILSLRAQSCFGVLIKEGGGFEMTNFDGKGKSVGTLKYRFVSVREESGFTVADIELESFSNKGKSEYKQKFTMQCNGNESMIDARSMVMEEQLKSFDSYKMTLTSNDIVYPNQFQVGQTLKDASLKGSGDMSGIPIEFDMQITDRKVVSKEKINVGAGEFDAFKITAHNKMMNKTVVTINVDFETVSYRAPGVIWDLKTETYRKGKLIAASELTKIY